MAEGGVLSEEERRKLEISRGLMRELELAHKRAQTPKATAWLKKHGITYLEAPTTGKLGVSRIKPLRWTYQLTDDDDATGTPAVICGLWCGRPGEALHLSDLLAVIPASGAYFYRLESNPLELGSAVLDASLHTGAKLLPVVSPMEWLTTRGRGWLPLYRLDRERVERELRGEE